MLVNSRYCNLYFKRLPRDKFSLPNGSLSMVCIQANKPVQKQHFIATYHPLVTICLGQDAWLIEHCAL